MATDADERLSDTDFNADRLCIHKQAVYCGNDFWRNKNMKYSETDKGDYFKEFPKKFIAATEEYCTLEKHVPAPYLRKSFTINGEVAKAEVIISGLGFYELSLNGARITKGVLAPYISAPDDVVYYDSYDITEKLTQSENVIGVILGNGLQNNPGGRSWDFDKARWRGAPKTALRVDVTYKNGETFSFESDESFKTSPSPITFDDLRCGEFYDARLEQPGWDTPGFDDTGWASARRAPLPRGSAVLCAVEPVVVTQSLKPQTITKQDGGFLYDFGVNCAGVCHLKINGEAGQTVSLEHGEYLVDGKLCLKNMPFQPEGYVQRDIYICRGGVENYIPRFTYHGFQYVYVTGITDAQATESLLTYLVMNSDLPERGGFECSDETANTLQTFTRRSTLANFYYFPTDCPHREKNGWTGDAALSAEHTLLNLGAENCYREWLRNVRKTQNEQGALPGIVPTGGWGFKWGNGPAWDCVLTWIPYYIYLYRNDTWILEENATAIFRYVHYMSTRINSEGLIKIGLGDWCPPLRKCNDYKAPLEVTDSIISMDICEKAAFIFGVLGMELQKDFALGLRDRLLASIRERLVDFSTMTVTGNCQTSQSMAIYFNVFNNSEKQAAFKRLVEMIDRADGHMDTGILGSRVIFHVLSDFGKSNLAFNMITRPDCPSYGNWVARGATSLWEDFLPVGSNVNSLNHHFFGDISGWFIQCIAGIKLNPHRVDGNEVNIEPSFIDALQYAKGFHIAPSGKIEAGWKRLPESIRLDISVPQGVTGRIILHDGCCFEDGRLVKNVATGCYTVLSK